MYYKYNPLKDPPIQRKCANLLGYASLMPCFRTQFAWNDPFALHDLWLTILLVTFVMGTNECSSLLKSQTP